MGQIALSEGHEETDPFDARDIQGKAFDFLMMEQVHIFLAYFCKLILSLDLHGFCLYPVTVLPVGAFGRNFTDVDLRIEIGSKGIAVVAAVAVQDVNVIDLVKFMFQSIRGKHSCNPRVKAAS